MGQVRVSVEFKQNFDIWSEEVLYQKTWSQEEMEGFKKILRESELADGPDLLRDQMVHYTPEGLEKPSAIDDPKERFRFWNQYFASEAQRIQSIRLIGEGVSDRIKQRKAA